MANCDPDEVYKWWASLDDDQRKLKETARLIEGVFGVTPSVASVQQYIVRHRFRDRLEQQVKKQKIAQKTKGRPIEAVANIDDLGSTTDLLEQVNFQLNTLVETVVTGVVRIANKKDFKASEAASLLSTAGDVMQRAAETRMLLAPLMKRGEDQSGAANIGNRVNEASAEILGFFEEKQKRT